MSNKLDEKGLLADNIRLKIDLKHFARKTIHLKAANKRLINLVEDLATYTGTPWHEVIPRAEQLLKDLTTSKYLFDRKEMLNRDKIAPETIEK